MRKVLVLLFVLAIQISIVNGQQIKPPQVGDKISSLAFRDIINYKMPNATMEDFKGKAIILDFWATWCNPCIIAFFKNDSLQNKFRDSLQILSVTYEDRETVNKLFANLRKFKNLIPPLCIVEDTMLTKLFKYRLVPHYVWIGADRRIKAITGPEDVNEENIRKFINGKDLNLPVKSDELKYNSRKPLFAYRQFEVGDELLYHSIFLRYQQGLPGISMSGKGYISLPNHSVTRLFQLILGKFKGELLGYNRIVLEGIHTFEDSFRIGMFTKLNWTKWKANRHKYVYSYEFYTADTTITRDSMFALARQDLDRFFSPKGLHGRIEKKRVSILALVRTSEKDKISTKNGKAMDKCTDYSIQLTNMPLSRFIEKFRSGFENSTYLPISNKTSVKSKVDLSVECDLRDINAVNRELAKYDLKFIEQVDEMEVIVISKTSSTIH